jgi:hypothetical protein
MVSITIRVAIAHINRPFLTTRWPKNVTPSFVVEKLETRPLRACEMTNTKTAARAIYKKY